MRTLIAALPLLTCSCEPWKDLDPVDETGAEPKETGVSETETGVSETETGVSETETGVSETGTGETDSGDGATFGHPCDALGLEHGTCCLLVHNGYDDVSIAAVDPTVGGEGATVVSLLFDAESEDGLLSEEYAHGVLGISRLGNTLIACGSSINSQIVDLTDGTVTTLSNLSCTNTTPWQGDDPYAGGIVVHGLDGMLRWYADESSLAEGLPDDYIGAPGSQASRIAIYDDVLLGGRHSDNALNRWSLPELEELPELPLEDFSTWIWGMSVVDGVLYLIDDGRGGDGTGVTRLLSFDVETGAQLGYVYFPDDYTEWNGLHCESR